MRGCRGGAAGGASTTAAKPAKARPVDGASAPGVFGRGGAAPRRSHQLERYSATGSGQAHERCPVDMAAGVCRQLVPPHRRHCRRVPDPVRGAAVPSCYAPPRQGGSMRHEMSTHKRHPHNTQHTPNRQRWCLSVCHSHIGPSDAVPAGHDAWGPVRERCDGACGLQVPRIGGGATAAPGAQSSARSPWRQRLPRVALDALVAALALLVRDFAAPAFARPGTGTGPLAPHGVGSPGKGF